MDADRKEKFGSLYEKKKNLVYRTAFYYSKNVIEAEDFMQAAFLKLYTRMDEVQDEKHAEYWLMRTVKNMVINYHRKSRREDLTDDIVLTSDLHRQTLSTEDVMQINEHNKAYMDFRDEVFSALYEENKNWYFAVTMVFYMNVTYDIAARELGMNTESLYSMVYRAKQWIKRMYGDKYKELKDLE